jgi:uncharacterized protein (TIGR02646 family)
MRTINKRNEPASLTLHRLIARADYDNYADKDTLRQSLAVEQRGLCCYCLSRIRPAAGNMKIAHWHSRNLHPNEQLVYMNLLGACMGNEGQSPQRQHCDTRQGNRDISRNPANPTHQVERFVHFEADGRITSDDPHFKAELNDVLNLNVAILKNNRKATLEAFKITLIKRGDLPRATLERWLRDWNGESHANELPPFSQVVVYWLRKRLART